MISTVMLNTISNLTRRVNWNKDIYNSILKGRKGYLFAIQSNPRPKDAGIFCGLGEL